MDTSQRKAHWDKIYDSKKTEEVSWFQEIPLISLELIDRLNLPLSVSVIDIGGGDSRLAENLLKRGFQNISVLDISARALEKAKKRLCCLTGNIRWIVGDVTEFEPEVKYDLWHDRAAFHFLNNDKEIKKYALVAARTINENGFMVIGTFSENGPKKCSGLETRQYSIQSVSEVFNDQFELIYHRYDDHKTPLNTLQNFLFCCFRKRGNRL